MMPWSGLSPASVEHANEMGTSELPHWTSIMLAAIALTTDRSMNPGRPQTKGKASQASAKGNLSDYLPHWQPDGAAAVLSFCLTETAPLPKS
ncbi:hypothetical protein BN949_04644 [Agrobacterium tumefaciens]|jgi:hypothetical protein|nr:hypothetical protein BN949_04644 [Agrobacterium tumefaciens]